MKLAVGIACVLALAVALLAFAHTEPKEPLGTHDSMYFLDNRDFFASSLVPYASTSPLHPSPRLFIVNQHVLAASLIAHQFSLAADPSVKTVVLATQNNWDAGTEPIITSLYDWRTPLGAVPADTALAGALAKEGKAAIDESVFEHEHGITGIVPYVAHAFPNASFVPLVIRDTTPDALLDALAGKLATLDPATTVIVASIDMSHYLSRPVADAHDRKTVEAIRSFDHASLPRLDIDTAPTLRLILRLAEARGERAFLLTGHANSATIVGDPDLLSTTSYLTGYFTRATTTEASAPVHALFVGDIMLDRAVASHAKNAGDASLFGSLERLFLGTDAVVGNLEGTITGNESVAAKDISVLRFTFDPHFAGFLKSYGFSAVSLANNHALDFGSSGYAETAERLTAASVAHFGSPRNDTDLSTTLRVRDANVCLVGYHALFTPSTASVVAEIQRLRSSCTYVIAMAHWGVEYSPSPTTAQREEGHALIDAGADIVVGAHPHVVEPLEIYEGKPIFYSLGNFIFDQDFASTTRRGLTLDMELSRTEERFTLVPITITGSEAALAGKADRDAVLEAVVERSLSPDIAASILTSESFTLTR